MRAVRAALETSVAAAVKHWPAGGPRSSVGEKKSSLGRREESAAIFYDTLMKLACFWFLNSVLKTYGMGSTKN